MEATTLLYSSLSLISFMLILKFILIGKTKKKLHLPPSPSNSLPIIGHLHLLNHPIHRTFHSLSQKLGPIISLRLGSHLVYVVSSPSIAQECFTKHDVVLANRPYLKVGKHIGYNFTTMVSAPYGDHWRNLRRIGSLEIFSTHRLNSFSSIRRDENERLITKLANNGPGKVEIRPLLMNLTINNVMRMIAGKRYCDDDLSDKEEAKRVTELIHEVIKKGGVGNKADHFPILNWLSGFENSVKEIGRGIDLFLQSLIDEERRKNIKGNFLIAHLLSLQESQPEYYTDQIIKGLGLTMLLAGTDTSAVTVEWALANLLNNPSTLKKARMEIGTEVGQDKLIHENDLSKLPYIQNIILETLRLTPTAPLFLPHLASGDCVIAGYDMPRDTTLVVNAWAIHRDPNVWDEPTSFIPERFEKKGEVEKIMPFGLGRRACPGEGMAKRVVSLTLASLIQCFEWERISETEIDMSEGGGTTMHKATPLVLMCKPRQILDKVLPNQSA